jgi:hypothetical protein
MAKKTKIKKRTQTKTKPKFVSFVTEDTGPLYIPWKVFWDILTANNINWASLKGKRNSLIPDTVSPKPFLFTQLRSRDRKRYEDVVKIGTMISGICRNYGAYSGPSAVQQLLELGESMLLHLTRTELPKSPLFYFEGRFYRLNAKGKKTLREHRKERSVVMRGIIDGIKSAIKN